jgi:transcriptional regulator with XRE-family HTH domain
MYQTLSKENRRKITIRLRQVMGRRTQKEWGQELGFPQQTISRYLRDGNVPKMDFLHRLSQKDRVNLNWLILGEGRMKRQS